jgi:hypothetical protein
MSSILDQAYFAFALGLLYLAFPRKQEGTSCMAEKSAIQRIKELDEERAKIFDQAKEEALEKAKAAVEELNALGLDYTLLNGERKAARAPKKVAASKQGTIKDAPCSVCEFETSPPHDARAHRGQTKKKPFTAAELTEKGLTKL